MRKTKPLEQQQSTDFSQHILQFQNQMLNNYVNILKRELGESRKLNQDDQSTQIETLKRENQNLSRRIRIISSYNAASIERNSNRMKEVLTQVEPNDYECLCGAAEVREIVEVGDLGYQQFARSAFCQEQGEQQQQPIEVEKVTIEVPQQQELIRMIVDRVSDEKAALQKTIEELRIASKIPESEFMNTRLYESLVQQNRNLVTLINSQDRMIRQLQTQLDNEIQSTFELHEKLNSEYIHNHQVKQIKQKEIPTTINQDIVNNGEQQFNQQLYYEKTKRERIHVFQQCEQAFKNELIHLRNSNKQLMLELAQETQQKHEQAALVTNLKTELNGLKVGSGQYQPDQSNNQFHIQVVFRYDKHKVLLQEIESEYARPKGSEYLSKFRELVGYIKMRDEKVKGLDHQIELKQQEVTQLKKRIESLFEELDYNTQENTAQMEKNQVLSRLLDETQKNEARAVQERRQEKTRLENENKALYARLSDMEETLRLQNSFAEQMRQQNKLIEGERLHMKEMVELIQTQMSEQKEKFIINLNELEIKRQELSVLVAREQLGEVVNQKYIKAAEKGKAKSKALKVQLKQHLAMKRQGDDSDTDLVASLKIMVNCQQCKKKLKEAILIKCLHMFCKGCLDDNLKNRNRACSICRTRYGQEDVKQIKFT